MSMKLNRDVMTTEAAHLSRGVAPQPGMIELGDCAAPEAPSHRDDLGLESDIYRDLVLKLAYLAPRFTNERASQRLCLPLPIVSGLLKDLCEDHHLEILGQSGPFNYSFAITGRGRERAERLMEVCGYVGPAPVSLFTYRALLEIQLRQLPQPSPEDVAEAVSDLVLPDGNVEVAGLAMLARRSLFLHGPPGNGKTSLAHLLHTAVQGGLWIPHCIGIENTIIRVFDPESHELANDDLSSEESRSVDARWVRIKRPFIVVGGELTIDALDLAYIPSLGYYEAPLHFKANGGTFLLDDFGCQRVDSLQLLNRWIHPLERGIDFLTLRTGQQLEVPFRQMLIVSTNLKPQDVMTPAFSRRMGYRLHMDNPSPDRYADIFRQYASRCNLTVPDDLLDWLMNRYDAEKQPRHCCEPRDLIERVRDACRFRNQSPALTKDLMDLAWRSLFGSPDSA